MKRKAPMVQALTQNAMRQFARVLSLLTIITLGLVNRSFGQVFPVQGSAVLVPPYSLHLSDYTSSTTDRIILNVVLNNVARPELPVRLRVSIKSKGVSIETKPTYIGSRITLQGGIPLRLTGTDLLEYFQPQNLNFSGIDQKAFEKSGLLPEGFYQFCFEVLEYNRGVKISNTICAQGWLILNDPPIVNLPKNNTKLKPSLPQNVVLQWTPRHTGSPNSAFTTNYEITMVEVWPATRNPNDAILTSTPILQTTTSSTSFVYGPAETPLELGRKYAFRVKAKSSAAGQEYDLFKNNGYSEVFSFTYGDVCECPLNITSSVLGPSRFKVKWDLKSNHTSFNLRYREAGKNTSWFTTNTLINELDVSSLKASTAYEFEVSSVCGPFESPYSTTASVKTTTPPVASYSCGVPIQSIDLNQISPLPKLNTGDIIKAGDFDVTIGKVTGSNGVFSGEGAVVVSYFNKAKVKVEFKDLTVNTDYRMVKGFMNVTGAGIEVIPQEVVDLMDDLVEAADMIESGVLDPLEQQLQEEEEKKNFDPHSFVAEKQITVTDGIKSVSKAPDGTIVIVDNKGVEQRIPAGSSMAVVDNSGKAVLVDSKGKTHETTSAIATKATKREYKLVMDFAAGTGTINGFDPKKVEMLAANYEQVKDNYYAAWKSLESGKSDPVVATLKDGSLDKSKIRFEIGGQAVTGSAFGSSTSSTVTVPGTMGTGVQDLIALYTPATGGKDQLLGKVKVIGYDPIVKDVVIVPVNGATLPATGPVIQTRLNEIYKQAIVTWNVTVAQNLQVTLPAQFDDGETGMLSNYTADMRTVINAFKANLEEDKFYIFVVGLPTKSGILSFGRMPRGKQAGFVFSKNLGTDATKFATTIAHELGHGAFSLHHIFKEFTGVAEGSTDNLMDYPAGSRLYKYQWDEIRYPEIVVGLFEEDDDAKSATVNNIEVLDKFKNEDGSLTFLSIAGKPITLKGNVESVSFITPEDAWELTKTPAPLGTLVKFTVDGETYLAHKAESSNDFNGYYSNNKKQYYADAISYSKKYKNVLVGIPCWKEKALKFRVFPTSYIEKNPSYANVKQSNYGEGTQREKYFLESYFDKESLGVDVVGQFDITYTFQDLYFIDQQAGEQDIRGKDALYLINIAYLVHKNNRLQECLDEGKAVAEQIATGQLSDQQSAETQGQSSAMSTAVAPHPLTLAAEQEAYDTRYKELYKEKYLENLNNAFTLFSTILQSKDFSTLDKQQISGVIDFLAVDNAEGRTCLLKNIPLDLRLKLLYSHKEWTITDHKEELMADLVETLPAEDGSEFLKRLSASSYDLLWSLDGDLNMSEYDRFIFAITSIASYVNPETGIAPVAEWPENDWDDNTDVESKFLFIGKQAAGATKEGETWQDSYFGEKVNATTISVGRLSRFNFNEKTFKRFYKGDPFGYVCVTFTDDFQFPNIKSGENRIASGTKMVVPAIWLYWLINEQEQIRDFRMIRVALNAFAIVVSVATMEPGPMLLVEVATNGIDIVVAINEDAINSSNDENAKAILSAWNMIYATYGAALITKAGISGIYSFKPETLRNIGSQLRNTPVKLGEYLAELFKLSTQLSKQAAFKGKDLLNAIVFTAMLEIKILNYVSRKTDDFKLFIGQGDNLIFGAEVNGVYREVGLGKAVAVDGGTEVKLNAVRWFDASKHGEVKQVVAEVNAISHLDQSGKEVTGRLRIVRAADHQAYITTIARAAATYEDYLYYANEAYKIYSKELEAATQNVQKIAGDLGEVTSRAKRPESAANRLQRAVENGWVSEINSTQKAVENIWDALGTRVILKKGDAGSVDAFVERLCVAIKNGEIEVVSVKSLTGVDGIPYLSESHLAKIEQAGVSIGKRITALPKEYESGYTVATIYIKYANNVRGELQVIGQEVLQIANAEHWVYDVFLKKPYAEYLESFVNPEAREIAEQLIQRIRTPAASLSETAQLSYKSYLNEVYKNARNMEANSQGVGATTNLPNSIPAELSIESLLNTEYLINGLKNGTIDNAAARNFLNGE